MQEFMQHMSRVYRLTNGELQGAERMNPSTVVLQKRAHYGLSAHPQFSLDFLLRSRTYLKECPPNTSIAIPTV